MQRSNTRHWAASLGLCAALSAPAAAQSTVMISGYQDAASTRTFSVTPGQTSRQNTTATFLIQGDDLPLGGLTVSHSSALNGSKDLAWLQNSDAGFQATLLLNTTFSAQIEGAPAQADAAGALQSLIGTAAAQGYTTIPSGSYIKFTHALDLASLPVMQKNTVQVVDSYTLQNAALGVGSSADGVGVLYGKATAAPAPAPAKVPVKTPATAPVKAPVKAPVSQPVLPVRPTK